MDELAFLTFTRDDVDGHSATSASFAPTSVKPSWSIAPTPFIANGCYQGSTPHGCDFTRRSPPATPICSGPTAFRR